VCTGSGGYRGVLVAMEVLIKYRINSLLRADQFIR
jgi:hypothetical protein